MKKYKFKIIVISLVMILIFVSFYMFFVHLPYYNHYHRLDEIRNQICEDNNYQYLDYFYEHRGNEVYYILKVKLNDTDSYVAYNEKLELIDTLSEEVASKEEVQAAIVDKYKVSIDHLEIGYENEKFVYCGKYQDKDSLMYIYYDLVTGEFMKAVTLMENR